MSQTQATERSDQILIVDDTPANLDVLCRLLEAQGYRVLAVPNGEVALRLAAEVHPDLILLDVMMPEINGYEVCRQIKQSPLTADVPVIFISARDEIDSLVQGFAAGGVDYITKPFHADEVIIRVETHLKINRLNRQLMEKNDQMSRRLRSELTEAIDALCAARSIAARRERKMHWRLWAGDFDGVVGSRKPSDGELRVLSGRAARSSRFSKASAACRISGR